MTVTIHDLRAWKAEGKRFAMLTAYDFPTAQILDEAGIPVLLVGDSLGNNVLGYKTTLPVTMEEMLHHTRAVVAGRDGRAHRRRHAVPVVPGLRRGRHPQRRPVPQGGRGARREARGGAGRADEQARRARDPGDGARRPHPAVAPRDGRLPSPGPRRRGRRQAVGPGARDREGGRVLPRARGHAVGGRRPRSRRRVQIPTIGIGAGPQCDAQVLVITDLLGLGPRLPRFAKAYADLRGTIGDAARTFAAEVQAGAFPDGAHTYH